jgi:hypothetical protein
VVVDLGAETGGNCELTRPGETVDAGRRDVLGPLNVPSTVPYHASQMFGRNVLTFVQHVAKDGRLASTSTTRSPARWPSSTTGGCASLTARRAAPAPLPPRPPMAESLIASVVVFVLATFLGVELIGRVPPDAAHAADVGRQRGQRHHRGRRAHRRRRRLGWISTGSASSPSSAR